MMCIKCFLSDEFQFSLKRKISGDGRFENTLTRYRKEFVEKLKAVVSVEECESNHQPDSELDGYWQVVSGDLVQAADVADETFQRYIEIYNRFLRDGFHPAFDLMSSVIGADARSASPLTNARLYFRARKFKERPIELTAADFFHVPFSMRNIVDVGRFSILGHPLLYAASSTLAALHEISASPKEAVVAAFIASDSSFGNKRIFDLSNPLGTKGQANYRALLEDKIPIAPSWGDELRRSVAFHVLTYPVTKRSTFVPEYVLPQLMMEWLRGAGYSGILYPSTKQYELTGAHPYTDFGDNLTLFPPYHPTDDHDPEFLHSFTFVAPPKRQRSLSEINQRQQDLASIAGGINGWGRNRIAIPNAMIKRHIDDLQAARIGDVLYFDTEYGQLELNLLGEAMDYLATSSYPTP